MLKVLLSLIPNDKPAYLVLDAESKRTLGILHLEVQDTVRYYFQRQVDGRVVTGSMMVNVLEEALAQKLEVDFTEPQDLVHSS